MSWKAWLKLIATFIVFGAIMFLVGRFTSPASETITINLAESEKQQIIQDAQLRMITLDSAKALITSESKIDWILNIKDSIILRDSLNIRDSVRYIPVYTARDTTIEFNDTSEVATVSLTIMLRQRFFPLQERFASELKLMSLTVELPKQKESGGWFGNFFEHRFIIYGGVGVNYGNGKFEPGFQLGTGIRIL